MFVQVFVVDSSQHPVEGATVYLSWEGASGRFVLRSGRRRLLHRPHQQPILAGKVTLTVTGVAVPGGTYDAGSNQDPDGDSNGTSITISA